MADAADRARNLGKERANAVNSTRDVARAAQTYQEKDYQDLKAKIQAAENPSVADLYRFAELQKERDARPKRPSAASGSNMPKPVPKVLKVEIIEPGPPFADDDSAEDAEAECHLSGCSYTSNPVDANMEGSLSLAIASILKQHKLVEPASALDPTDVMLVAPSDKLNPIWTCAYDADAELKNTLLLKLLPNPKMLQNVQSLYLAPLSLKPEVEALLRKKGLIQVDCGDFQEEEANQRSRGGRGRRPGIGSRSRSRHAQGGAYAATPRRPWTKYTFFSARYKEDNAKD